MKATAPYVLASQPISVTAGEVHLWHACLDRSGSEMARLEEHLASHELSRAAQFRKASDRRRFVACRGMLREILSRYIGEAPGEVAFGYAKHGKPHLKLSGGTHSLRFNVSHAEELAVFAVARDREVGVDIERFQANFAWEEVATSFFSAAEVRLFLSLPNQRQYEAFLRAWTCKEAYAKARGDGLSASMEQLEASQLPDQSCSFRLAGDSPGISRWMLTTFVPIAGFTGALVIEGTGWQMACRQWRE